MIHEYIIHTLLVHINVKSWVDSFFKEEAEHLLFTLEFYLLNIDFFGCNSMESQWGFFRHQLED